MAQAQSEFLGGRCELWRDEIVELQHNLLPQYLEALGAVLASWLLWTAWQSSLFGPADAAWALLGTCSYIAYRLWQRCYVASCWLLILACVVTECLLVLACPQSLVLGLGVVVVIMASALLGNGQALAAAALTWGASIWTWHHYVGAITDHTMIALTAIEYLLVWGTVGIARQPFRHSLELALSGWEQLRHALAEARERRGQLSRTVRALEEASYRIERMNNELILARHQAEVARANKARFAAIVSHELRGPLNLILGFSELMVLSPERYGVALPRAYRADMDTIYASSRHLVSLLDDILDLSQIEAERMPLVRDRVNWQEDVVQHAVQIVGPLAERKGLWLRVSSPVNQVLPPLHADKVRLRQVMLNLLTNAVRFTERGGIEVRTELRTGELLVSVRDTGRGIPAGEMPRLFEEFQQLSLTEDKIGRGSGLGLAISKYLIQLHGGRIWAESAEGQGTTFYFTLPLPGHSPSIASLRYTGGRERPMENHRTCLVVHEDPFVLKLFARYLDGYRIVGLPNEREVAVLTRELLPRAIITTPELAEQVYQGLLSLDIDVPVIACSMPRLKKQTQIEGALTYLLKPITKDMIEAVLAQIQCEGEMTVMVVDDDRDTVRLMEALLQSLARPCHVLRAYDGHEALTLMRKAVPDLVFLDLLMPGLDGETTLHQMRADPRLADVPVAIISARDSAEGMITLGTWISVRSQRALDAAQGIKRLQAILDALSPAYVSDAATVLSSQADAAH